MLSLLSTEMCPWKCHGASKCHVSVCGKEMFLLAKEAHADLGSTKDFSDAPDVGLARHKNKESIVCPPPTYFLNDLHTTADWVASIWLSILYFHCMKFRCVF